MHQYIQEAVAGEDDPKWPPPIASRYTGIKQNTLRDWRKKFPERIKFIKLGKAGTPGVRVLYRKSALDEFLRQAERGEVAA